MASLILLVGFVDDVRSRKVHNSVVIALFLLALVATLSIRGFTGSVPGVAALLVALLATVPMFSYGILGGGDVKLFAVFALALDVPSTVDTLIYSLVWGALFGLVRAAVSKQLLVLIRNTYRVGLRPRQQTLEVQKIPYTFALLLGWLTQLTMLRGGF